MYKLYISLVISTFIVSCSTQKTATKMNDGYYIGKLNKDLIFNYTVLINIKDSTATLEAYVDEKGMVTACNIFNSKQILPNSEYFQFYNRNEGYILSNSLNQVTVTIENGSFVMRKPLELKLKYYKENPVSLYPSKKYALYCYSWLYPHVILGIGEELNGPCKVYIQNKIELNLKNIDENLSYEDYFTAIKDSITQYKLYFDNTYH